MSNIISFLTGWIVEYINNKDVLAKKIEHIEYNKDGFEVVFEFNDKVQFFIVMPSIGDMGDTISKVAIKERVSLVVLNNEKNLKAITSNWKILAAYKSFNIYFVNPFSNLDKKWIISPYVHSRVCDEGSLELGLRSMFGAVEPISEEEAENILNKQ